MFALFLPLFSVDLEGIRSLFGRFEAAANPRFTIFGDTATVPSGLIKGFKLLNSLW
jgi:hypothetical protein